LANADPGPAPKRLCWEREDIERKLCFPAGKFTAANPLLTCILGTLLALLFYAALLPIQGGWFGQKFYARGPTPYVTVFFATWSLAILFVKWRKLRVQERALQLQILPDSYDFVLSPVTAKEILNNLYALVDDPRHFLLLNRILRSLGSLKNMGRVSDVDEVLRSQADNDENHMEGTYTLVSGFVWAIPVLGFIGTVLGLSDAIGTFGGIMTKGADVEALKTGLQGVTAGLSVAFDTTLIALVAALAIQLLLTMLRQREQDFLDRCGDYCHANIVSKVRIVVLEMDRAVSGANR